MKWSERKDPVARMVCDSTAEEFVEWMVKYKKLDPAQAENVESNLREAFKWHRLQGRIDRSPLLQTIAVLLGLRQSVSALEKPEARQWNNIVMGDCAGRDINKK